MDKGTFNRGPTYEKPSFRDGDPQDKGARHKNHECKFQYRHNDGWHYSDRGPYREAHGTEEKEEEQPDPYGGSHNFLIESDAIVQILVAVHAPNDTLRI